MENDDVFDAGEVFDDPALFEYLFGEDPPTDDEPLPGRSAA